VGRKEGPDKTDPQLKKTISQKNQHTNSLGKEKENEGGS